MNGGFDMMSALISMSLRSKGKYIIALDQSDYASTCDCGLVVMWPGRTNGLLPKGVYLVSGHMPKCTSLWMKKQVRHVFIFSQCYGILHVRNNNLGGKFIFPLICGLCMCNIGLIIFLFFLLFYCKNKKEKAKCQMALWEGMLNWCFSFFFLL